MTYLSRNSVTLKKIFENNTILRRNWVIFHWRWKGDSIQNFIFKNTLRNVNNRILFWYKTIFKRRLKWWRLDYSKWTVIFISHWVKECEVCNCFTNIRKFWFCGFFPTGYERYLPRSRVRKSADHWYNWCKINKCISLSLLNRVQHFQW